MKSNSEVKKYLDKDKVFIEMPINNIENDKFEAHVYSEQIASAINEGAKFIAIDGEYGTGKSSVMNLFSSSIKINKKEKKKNKIINISFLNINENLKEESDETDNNKITNIINKYHRYFVNQVGNALYKNPYSIEKLFYNNYFSYETVSLRNNSLYKKVIDKILLLLVSYVSIYLIYAGFFKSITMFKDLYNISTNIMPFVLFTIFVLIILYGYGFYKPEKVEKSPMLDIDKCKNNLCKVLFNTIPSNGYVYFIIDDLDRIDKELQLPIISLLYNEYYNIDSVLNSINIKFIFMIDLSKIENDDQKNINIDKLFDYVINISNNQPIILRDYIEKQIKENTILKKVFDNIENSDYLIGIISNNYSSIRKVKHLFNRIITKYLYLTEKKYDEINYSELVVICILIGLDNISSLNTKLNQIINKNDLVKLSDTSVYLIIKESNLKNMIDNNYYIYLSNFIDVNNLLNPNEQEIYNICNNPFSNEKDWKQNYDILNKKLVNFSKVYNRIYKYLPNNQKILLLGDKDFYEYVKVNYYIDVDMKDFYKNNFINIKYYNYYNYEFFFNSSCEETLNNLFNEFLSKEQGDDIKEKEAFFKEFKIFINNLKCNIKFFDLKVYLDSIELTKDIFDLICLQEENNESIIYNMLLENKISWDSIKSFIDLDFIMKLNSISDETSRIELEKYILEHDFSLTSKLYIIKNESIKFDKIDSFLSVLSTEDFDLCYDDLKIVLEKYDYNQLIDKYICQYLKDKKYEKKIISFVNSKEYKLSNPILDCINCLKTKYPFSDFYEKLFKCQGYYNLYIYSNALNKNKFTMDFSLLSNNKYLDAFGDVYKNAGPDFAKYEYSTGIQKYLIDNYDFSQITFDSGNLWKIDILIPNLLTYSKCLKVFNRLKECDKFNNYITHYRNSKIDNYEFLNFMKMYAQEICLSSGTKSNITKLLNKSSRNKKVFKN